MLKRIILFMFALSVLALIVLAPMNVNSVSANTPKQATLVPEPPIATVLVPATPSENDSIPVTGGIPMSMLIIIGLLVLLTIVVVIGGIAMMSNRNNNR